MSDLRQVKTREGVYQNENVVFVELTKGRRAILKRADWRRVAETYGEHWSAVPDGKGRYYARREYIDNDGGRHLLTLARAVMGAEDGERVEVINGDSLDCRKMNLRVLPSEAAAEQRRCWARKRRVAALSGGVRA
jgi:hypothetical protein